MPIAVNHDTGEVRYLTQDGSWQPAPTSVNPDTKEMLAFDGQDWKPVASHSKGILNYIDDVGRALALGATFGFADKIAARADTATKGGSYEENLAKQRQQSEQIPAAIKIPGEIGGAVASSIAVAPETAAISALTGAARLPGIVRAMGAGAGIGATQAAGESDNITPGDIAQGAAIGGVTGGVAQPIIAGAKMVARPIIGTIMGAINPGDEAARRVGSAIKRDVNAGDAGLSPEQFSFAKASGAPIVNADMGGKVTQSLARSAANTSPEARAVLENFANDRFEGQTDRAATFIQGLTGTKGDIGAINEEIQTAARKANAPAYQAAYEAGDKPIWSPTLERLSASPTIQSAIRGAERKWADWQAIDGFGAMNPPARVADGGILKFNGGGLKTFPNIQYWDYVARDLAGKAQAANEAGNRQEAARFGGLEKLLKGELDKIVPEFNDARVGASRFFGAQNALEAGQNFVTAKMDLNDATRAFAKMSPEDQKLFKFGFTASLLGRISQISDRTDVTKRIAASPDAKARIQIALGNDSAQKLQTFLNVESVMARLKDAVTGNSTTARQLMELGLAGGTLGYGEYTNDPQAMTKAALVYGLARGQRFVDQRVVNKVADLLISNDPKQLLAGVEMVNKNAQLAERFRAILTRVTTQEAAKYGAQYNQTNNFGFSPQGAKSGISP